VTNDGNGFAAGGGSYQSGTYATATAYPYAPYEFWCWDTDTGTYFTASISILMNGNHWAHAMFTLPWGFMSTGETFEDAALLGWFEIFVNKEPPLSL